MAGTQPAKGRPYASTNGFNLNQQSTFYLPSSPQDTENIDESRGGSHVRDHSSKPPNLVAPSAQVQQNGFALSSRSQSTTGLARSPSGLNSGLERRPSATHAHYRQTSRAHAIYQHSRNTSYVNSPTTSPLSPQLNGSGSLNVGPTPEVLSITTVHHSALERRPCDSPSSTANDSINSSSTSTLGGDQDVGDASNAMLGQKRVDRAQSAKGRRGHGHHRSQSKQQHLQEQKTVCEYALHHLFNSFIGQADHKINQCVMDISDTEPRVEDVCGPGVDPSFDQLISALGHIARQKPRPLIDTIMFWRKTKGEAATTARAELNQSRSPYHPMQRVLPRRHTEPLHVLNSDPAQTTSGAIESNYSTSASLQDLVVQADRRSLLSIYLLCRVLIEVYNQTKLTNLTPQMADRLEDIIFGQLKQVDPEQVNSSSFRLANWSIYCQLLGVMSDMDLQSVSQRFTSELKSTQNAVSVKVGGPKETENKIYLMIMATRHLRVKTQPESAWKATCDFLLTLAELFIASHGQDIKHAYCQVLEDLVTPIAASATPQVNSPKWKEFVNSVNSRLTQMLVKPRHWADAFRLSAVILCASPTEVFATQWLQAVTSLQAKLKDRTTRAAALQSICRLVWTYLDRTTEPISSTIRKLEDVMKIVLPTGKRSYLSTDPIFAEPIVELIRIIGYRYQDFCFRTIIFPLINAELFTPGKEIKVEQLDPERMVIGIRAFLAIMADLEKAEHGRPPFPQFRHDRSIIEASFIDSRLLNSPRQSSRAKLAFMIKDDAISRPVAISAFEDTAREYYTRFCEILGKITIICDNAFGGQAVLDEKFGGLTPKTPISETFSFSRRDEHPALTDHRHGFFDLLHVAVQALPRCLSTHIPFNSLINLLCTGTAHVQSNIARSSAQSLKSIARQAHAQPVTMGFARFIFNFDARYSTMSDEGMLGPGHIENTLRLYVELLQIWIEEIKQKTKDAASEPTGDGSLGSGNRGLQLDLTNVSAQVEEVESHGIFFLCSQSRRVRSFAVKVLRLVIEFDTALGGDHHRIIQILEGDSQRVMDSNDDQLSVAERSRLQKGKRKNTLQNTLIELCSSDVSYDSTLWFKIFPNLIRLSFEMCQMAVTLGREIVCARLLQMHESICNLAKNSRGPQIPGIDSNGTRILTRLGATPPEVIVEQWKLYLVMACTTMVNTGAQTQSQLAHTQHARKISNKGAQTGQDKIVSARALFAYIIPLLSAGPSSIRDAVVIALGSININLYRTLLESLQYAVTTCKEEAKLRIGTHQRNGSSPRKNRQTDRLRTEVTHVYKLTARFLREQKVFEDEWILNNLSLYTKDLMIFLSDAEIQNDWECQKLRRQYCGLLEELFDGINRTKDPSRWMAFESRKSAFALMEDWCGYSPNQSRISQREDTMRQSALDQQLDTGERTNVTAAMEIEKRNLTTAALSAMAALCGGPIWIKNNNGENLSFDVRRMLSWIDQIFGTVSDKMHLIGRRALESLITHNRERSYLLEHSIEMCYAAERPRALESYFEVVTRVLMEHDDHSVSFWRILGAVLFTLGNEKGSIRMKSLRLLRTLEQRQQRSSKLQDFDISISDRTTAVFKLAQFEISKRLAKKHTEHAFHIFSQFSVHFKNIHPDSQRSMVAAILPWIQTIELQLDPNGGPTAQSYMLLANLVEITTKASGALHNEVQALWQALATGPHGGNVQLVLDFVISLCLDRREQSFVDYAKQIIVYLSSTPAGQKVVEFLLLQITPKNMVQDKREAIVLPLEPAGLASAGLPYVADLSEALPIGNKQSGFSLGQLSLIFLVDLMVAPMKLAKESVPLLLQVVLVLWDHYTLLVQEQAREMLVHLIHELVITKIDDDTTTLNKNTIETFVESIRQHESTVVWTYEECSGKEDEDDGNRVPGSMTFVTSEVVDLFSIAYPRLHEQWAKITLSWATSCPVRHIACRSFQVFRCILSSLDQSMLADMLARLSNTIADEAPEIQTFSMEILTTLKTIIGALQPADLLKYPQLFWATCACLDTIYEREFAETLGMLGKLLEKIDLSDPAVIKLLKDAKPEKWKGTFEGIAPLVYKGLKSATSLEKSLKTLNMIVPLPDSDLVGTFTRLLFGVLANLPCFLHSFDDQTKSELYIQHALTLAAVAESLEIPEISLVLNAFANSRYVASSDFLTNILSTLRRTFFPTWELKSLVFLIGLLTNRLPWYKLKTLEILCAVIPEIDTRHPEVASQGPDLISPLLRLLQTEYCPQALEVIDHIMTMSAPPMDKHHMRMSMASSGSRSIRKEYEKTQSLYGIPEDTGWSVPMPAIHSSTTRLNMQAVFYTCANTNATDAKEVATPEIEFYAEEDLNGSYFPPERTYAMTIDDTHSDLNDDGMGDLVSKFDSLDNFFEDSLTSENGISSPYPNLAMTSFSTDSDSGADLYDRQTAPILNKSLARTGSITSLHNSFADLRGPSTRDPAVMTPAAFTTTLAVIPPTTSFPSVRPSLHARSVTSPANSIAKSQVADLVSDEETDETISEDERATGHGGSRMLSSTIRAKSNLRKHGPGAPSIEYRQRDLLRGQSRSRSQAPNSPEVPKVPEAYLQQSLKSSDL